MDEMCRDASRNQVTAMLVRVVVSKLSSKVGGCDALVTLHAEAKKADVSSSGELQTRGRTASKLAETSRFVI